MKAIKTDWLIIKELRDALDLPDGVVSDDKLLEATEGSLLRARIEMKVEMNNFMREVRLELDEFSRGIKGFINDFIIKGR